LIGGFDRRIRSKINYTKFKDYFLQGGENVNNLDDNQVKNKKSITKTDDKDDKD
jgi:hypothetical protein